MLLGTLSASLLRNILSGWEINIKGRGINRAGEGIVRAGYGHHFSKKKQYNEFLIRPYLLTNFEIQKCYDSESRFNGVYSRDNLPYNIKDGAYIKYLDEYYDIGTHWVALYVSNNDATYFDTFGVEHIPKEI